jgi:hypothetical protein
LPTSAVVMTTLPIEEIAFIHLFIFFPGTDLKHCWRYIFCEHNTLTGTSRVWELRHAWTFRNDFAFL